MHSVFFSFFFGPICIRHPTMPGKLSYMEYKWDPRTSTKKGSIQHILNSYTLADERYQWRHEQVLKATADADSTIIRKSRDETSMRANKVKFVGANKQVQRREKPRLLFSAPAWQLEVDLKKQLKSAKQIAEIALSPKSDNLLQQQ